MGVRTLDLAGTGVCLHLLFFRVGDADAQAIASDVTLDHLFSFPASPPLDRFAPLFIPLMRRRILQRRVGGLPPPAMGTSGEESGMGKETQTSTGKSAERGGDWGLG